jgi:hypothetical protein
MDAREARRRDDHAAIHATAGLRRSVVAFHARRGARRAGVLGRQHGGRDRSARRQASRSDRPSLPAAIGVLAGRPDGALRRTTRIARQDGQPAIPRCLERHARGATAGAVADAWGRGRAPPRRDGAWHGPRAGQPRHRTRRRPHRGAGGRAVQHARPAGAGEDAAAAADSAHGAIPARPRQLQRAGRDSRFGSGAPRRSRLHRRPSGFVAHRRGRDRQRRWRRGGDGGDAHSDDARRDTPPDHPGGALERRRAGHARIQRPHREVPHRRGFARPDLGVHQRRSRGRPHLRLLHAGKPGRETDLRRLARAAAGSWGAAQRDRRDQRHRSPRVRRGGHPGLHGHQGLQELRHAHAAHECRLCRCRRRRRPQAVGNGAGRRGLARRDA